MKNSDKKLGKRDGVVLKLLSEAKAAEWALGEWCKTHGTKSICAACDIRNTLRAAIAKMEG